MTSLRNIVAMSNDLLEPALTENARKVLEARYLKKDERGACIEGPRELFARVAGTIAAVEQQYGADEAAIQAWRMRFYHLMTSGDFMPNSPTLMNAGRDMGMLSACFVLPVRDSVSDIFDSIKHTALIQKAGGGTGFAFDELRPTGDYISSSGGTTSGPITFWRAFSEATNAIQQGAFRRGANMGMMYIHHPDILKFLSAKQDLTQFTNYNISVKVTDAWMAEFLAAPDSPHVVRNPRNGRAYVLPRSLDIWKYDVNSLTAVESAPPSEPRGAYFQTPRLLSELPEGLRETVYTKREIWQIILKNAWQTGEPGVVFIDRINETNPTPHVGRMEATNPCGEQPLLPYEACNLGSVNLGNFVLDECTPHARVDWDRLREVVHASTRYLDNVIDANNYPLPEIDNICKANRKIGLGIMGFADALYKLNVAYNSDAGVEWGERFMRFLNDEAHNCSEQLARERGPFPNWRGSTWHTRHNRLMRNACSTTVAPTGTISIISNCSGGIEPMFSLAFMRNVLRGQKQGERPLVEVNDTFRRVAAQRGFLSDALLERIATEGTLAHIDEIPDDLKGVFVCAHDIAPDWHMKMQAVFQRHCDASISKTINFPHAAEIADVEKIYRLAYELRCKGVTVYRDGCRSHQPMALKESDKMSAQASASQNPSARASVEPAPVSFHVAVPETVGMSVMPAITAAAPAAPKINGNGNGHRHVEAAPPNPAPLVPARPRLEPADLPEIVSGLRIRQMTPFGNMHVKITVDPRANAELEVFAQLGKGGDVATSDLEAICRMISLWLRAGGSLRHVIRQLEGIGSSLQIPTRMGRIMSLGDGLAHALKKYTRAKERFGLRALLLGEIDLGELDNPRGAGLPPTPDHDPFDHGHPQAEGAFAAQGTGNGGGGASRRSRGSGYDSPSASFDAGHASGVGLSAPASPNGSSGPCSDIALTANLHEQALASRSGSLTEALCAEPIRAATDSDIAPTRPMDGLTAVSPATLTIAAEAPSGCCGGGGTMVLTASVAVRAQHDMAEHYKVVCPECGGPLALQEGCRKCYGCGWSAC